MRTAKSATSALTGEDTLRLGGALYGQEFMFQLCTPQLCSPSPEEPLPLQPKAPWTPPVAIPSPPLKAEIIPLLTPPMDITPLPHRIPTPRGDRSRRVHFLLPDPGKPTLPASPTSEGDGLLGPDEYTTPHQMDTPIPNYLSRAGKPVDAYKSVGSNPVSPPVENSKRAKDNPVSPTVTKTRRLDISVDNPNLFTIA